jgi:hypothetical protein
MWDWKGELVCWEEMVQWGWPLMIVMGCGPVTCGHRHSGRGLKGRVRAPQRAFAYRYHKRLRDKLYNRSAKNDGA